MKWLDQIIVHLIQTGASSFWNIPEVASTLQMVPQTTNRLPKSVSGPISQHRFKLSVAFFYFNVTGMIYTVLSMKYTPPDCKDLVALKRIKHLLNLKRLLHVNGNISNTQFFIWYIISMYLIILLSFTTKCLERVMYCSLYLPFSAQMSSMAKISYASRYIFLQSQFHLYYAGFKSSIGLGYWLYTFWNSFFLKKNTLFSKITSWPLILHSPPSQSLFDLSFPSPQDPLLLYFP